MDGDVADVGAVDCARGGRGRACAVRRRALQGEDVLLLDLRRRRASLNGPSPTVMALCPLRRSDSSSSRSSSMTPPTAYSRTETSYPLNDTNRPHDMLVARTATSAAMKATVRAARVWRRRFIAASNASVGAVRYMGLASSHATTALADASPPGNFARTVDDAQRLTDQRDSVRSARMLTARMARADYSGVLRRGAARASSVRSVPRLLMFGSTSCLASRRRHQTRTSRAARCRICRAAWMKSWPWCARCPRPPGRRARRSASGRAAW